VKAAKKAVIDKHASRQQTQRPQSRQRSQRAQQQDRATSPSPQMGFDF